MTEVRDRIHRARQEAQKRIEPAMTLLITGALPDKPRIVPIEEQDNGK